GLHSPSSGSSFRSRARSWRRSLPLWSGWRWDRHWRFDFHSGRGPGFQEFDELQNSLLVDQPAKRGHHRLIAEGDLGGGIQDRFAQVSVIRRNTLPRLQLDAAGVELVQQRAPGAGAGTVAGGATQIVE